MTAPKLDYDHYIVYFSGGKDSIACYLYLLGQGVKPGQIELWHHDVDGREGGHLKMDWPCTRAYVQAFAAHFGSPLYFSWRVGGFEREMLRDHARTAPVRFETPDGIREIGGTSGKLGTRRKFPQTSADLRVRWCSGYLKVDVAATALRNQARFEGKRILTISGERAEESPARARYKDFEPDRGDGAKGRVVHRWRPVHTWTESQVWDIVERYKVNPHPSYHLGWGRCSCAACIFGNHDQWASLHKIAPQVVQTIADYEAAFGVTIHRTLGVMDRVRLGTPYSMNGYVPAALSQDYARPVIVNSWQMPAGAFGGPYEAN